MKKLKSITVALALSVATVFSVSSCLDSGNGGTQYPQMSLSDSIEAVNNAIGSFTGKLYYINPTKTTSNREDSVDVKWRISKETMTRGGMTIENFPIKPLALYVTNMTSMVKSKEILEAVLISASSSTINIRLPPDILIILLPSKWEPLRFAPQIAPYREASLPSAPNRPQARLHSPPGRCRPLLLSDA